MHGEGMDVVQMKGEERHEGRGIRRSQPRPPCRAAAAQRASRGPSCSALLNCGPQLQAEPCLCSMQIHAYEEGLR